MKAFIAAFFVMLSTLAAVAQSDTYKVRPGDVLRIEVLEDSSLNREVLILPDGQFTFPFAGTLRAGGRSLDDVRNAISQSIASNFAAPPTVFVSMAQLRAQAAPSGGTGGGSRSLDIYFLGEVRNPGQASLPRGTTFLQAMAINGGFTEFAATKRVQLRRTDASGRQQLMTINYKALSQGAAMDSDVVLRDGDVILVPERRLFE